MKGLKASILILVLLTFVAGCAHCPPVDPKHELIMRVDNYMIPLAKAFDAMADKLPPHTKDDEILQAIVKRTGNPGLLEPFRGYLLRARIQDGVGVFLLCTSDGKEGIIEDVTCTTRPDTHRPTGSPCEYLLDVKRVCAAP
jgi:hypothetical protein